MARSSQFDWQQATKEIKDRGRYLLETGIWSDCRFVVGSEPNQQTMEGHKLILAMASPVFEAMFYGGMPENTPISILDVQPEAFKALLEYIYTDKINLTSFDQACELCYGAKKYMIPHLVEECTKYLWSDLNPKNACRAFEFAKLFEEPILMDKCIQIISSKTQDVLCEESFCSLDLSTVITIFEQDRLEIASELDLFKALSRYASHQSQNNDTKVQRPENANANPPEEAPDAQSRYPTIRDAVKKIRFLTLTPQQFAEGPATSDLLSQSEKFAILMNISSPTTDIVMPEGFSTNNAFRIRATRHFDIDMSRMGQSTSEVARVIQPGQSAMGERFDAMRKFYCTRQVYHISHSLNTSVLNCAIGFTCDRNICVHGIQVPTQFIEVKGERNQYRELIYAHLLDADGSRLTYTHYSSFVNYNSLVDISFNRPIYIQKNKLYKVGVDISKQGCYPLGTYAAFTSSHGVDFTFEHDHGIIRSIIFSIPSSNPHQATPMFEGLYRFRENM